MTSTDPPPPPQGWHTVFSNIQVYAPEEEQRTTTNGPRGSVSREGIGKTFIDMEGKAVRRQKRPGRKLDCYLLGKMGKGYPTHCCHQEEIKWKRGDYEEPTISLHSYTVPLVQWSTSLLPDMRDTGSIPRGSSDVKPGFSYLRCLTTLVIIFKASSEVIFVLNHH